MGPARPFVLGMLILFLVGVPAAGGWAVPKPPAVESAAGLLTAGRHAYDEGRYAQSAQYAERLLRARRLGSAAQRHEGLNLLGQARTKLGEHRQALEALDRAEHLARRENLRKGLALTYIYIGDVYERSVVFIGTSGAMVIPKRFASYAVQRGVGISITRA